MEFLNKLDFDITQSLFDLLRILLAFILAVPIGWERHHSDRNIGLRTFPIVAIGACSFVLLGKQLPGADAASQARIIQGLLSGIGFIGGGAILKYGGNVRGLATAASIWCTGAIGAAVAFERIELAVVLSGLTFAIMRLLTPVVEKDNDEPKGDELNKDKIETKSE